MASRFCQFTQREFEDFLRVNPDGKPLDKGGFYRIPVYRTVELVYAKIIHAELSLRIYSTIEGGVARNCGADAIRICVAWRPSQDEQRQWEFMGLATQDPFDSHKPIWPMIVGGETKVLRVQGWRENLAKRLATYQDIVPPPCVCGCPTIWIAPKKGQNWNPFWGCVWRRRCPAKNTTN